MLNKRRHRAVKPAAYVTPVKPIATFSVKWDALLSRLDDDSSFRLVVVGGGAGGVELILAMVSGVSSSCGDEDGH